MGKEGSRAVDQVLGKDWTTKGPISEMKNKRWVGNSCLAGSHKTGHCEGSELYSLGFKKVADALK